MSKQITNGFQAVAQRIVNAEAHFVGLVREITGCNETEAVKAFGTMRKLKVIKLDAVNGRYNAKHGAFMEATALRNAIAH
jgi:hypothetical protein